MAKQRNESVKVPPSGLDKAAGRIRQLDRRRVIVEAAQVILRVALHVGGVGGGPVASVAHVAKQVERGAAERITARILIGPAETGHYGVFVVSGCSRTRYAAGNLHARFLVRIASALRDRLITGRERQAAPVEDGPARNRREHVGQA